jgi:sulfur-oxidizing protein SoxZ
LLPSDSARKPCVCAVSYLNTVPLVWGLLHDAALQPVFDLRFAVPSRCADELASGEADLGIVPVIEMARQKLDYFPGIGISSVGPVRSILLVSKVPYREIKTLATHIMETGNRKDAAGNKIPRDIIHTFTATFEGRAVFSAALGSGIAANPYFAFFLKVPGPGTLEFTWIDDEGETTVEKVPLVVA